MQSDQAVHDYWVGTCCVDLAITRCHLPWPRIPTGKHPVDEVTCYRGGRLAAPLQTIRSRSHRLDRVEQALPEAPREFVV